MTDYRLARDVGTIKTGILTLLILNLACVAMLGLWEWRLYRVKKGVETMMMDFMEHMEEAWRPDKITPTD